MLIALLVFTLNPINSHAISDSTPPVVEEVKILTPVVKPGNKVKIQAKVSDDVSGTEKLSLLFYSPNEANNIMAFLHIDEYDELSETYTFESEKLSRYAENGDWQLVMISATDYAGNKREMYATREKDFFENLYFTVDSNASGEEENEEIDDGFTPWEPKDDVDLNKEFTITFNTDFDISTILEKNIYVKDSSGNSVPLMFIIDRSSDLQSSKVTIAPVGSYRPGSTYTLYIEDILSKDGKILNENVKMQFSTLK